MIRSPIRCACVLILLCTSIADAKKKKPAATSDDVRAEIGTLSQTDAALATLYELDLKPAQLHLAIDGAEKSATTEPTPGYTGKETAKLKTALEQLKAEYLRGEDDEKIQTLRSQVIELNDAESTKLPDGAAATAASHTAAHELFQSLRASQIAAYLASHADQVTDPAERMVAVLGEIRDDDADESKAAIDDCAADVAPLVAGSDTAKYGEIIKEAMAWLTKNASQTKSLSDADFAGKTDALDKSARSAVREVASMDVLHNWMENMLAAALANPQMGDAAEQMLAAREDAH